MNAPTISMRMPSVTSWRTYLSVGPRVALVLFVTAAPAAVGQNSTLCHPGQATANLSVNGVSAIGSNKNMLFYELPGPGYEIPAGSGLRALWWLDMWMFGQVGGEIRGFEGGLGFYPGPLGDAGEAPVDCSEFDRVYKVSARDILEYESTGLAPKSLLDWPWQLGAPVEDGDGNPDNYDLAAGDRPAIEGHEMLWWIVNDKGSEPPNWWRRPLGMEIAVSAFAAESDDPVLDFATIYRYKFTYKGEETLTEAYVGHNVDLAGKDDRVGSDTTLGLAFAYGDDDFDEYGFGSRPPAIGIAVLDGVVGHAGEQLPMTQFLVFGGNATVQGRPGSRADHYNYLRGRWRDGVRMTYGGSGRGWSEIPVDFMFPGSPPEYWSEENTDGQGSTLGVSGDKWFNWSTGPFDMEPGETQELVFAVLWAQGEDRYDSLRKLKEAVPAVRSYWNAGFHIPLPSPPSVIPELYAPDDRSASQPTNLRLSWRKQPGHERHEVQVARHPDFTSLVDSGFTASPTLDVTAADQTTHYWRVRGVNAGGYGPWSKTWSFSTGSVEQVGPGALDIDGQGTWAFIQVEGAEGENDACNPAAESRFGCDEVGGNVVYGSFNGARTWIMYQATVGPGSSIGSFAPRDFELRFTVKGSYGYHAETTGRVIHVPFEAWDIGPVGPFGTNDPSDDVQLIPGLYSDNEGECFFGFGETPDDPFGLGWPVTDRIHAFYPAEDSTYDNWETAVKPLVAADARGCPSSPDTDEAALLVDVDRRPLQNLIFMMDPSAQSFRPEGIPIGNVIRFLTTKPTPPVPSAPADESEFYVLGSLDRLSLWWQLPPGINQSRVEVTRTRDGTEVVVDSIVSGSTIELLDLLVGYYSWRVSYSTEAEFWSEPSRFAVLSFASTEDELAGIPAVLTLREPYPNPTADIAHFDVGLPETGRVTLTAYDLLGRRVAQIADGPMTAGWRIVDWNTEAVSNGVYVVRLQAGGAAVSKKVVVVR